MQCTIKAGLLYFLLFFIGCTANDLDCGDFRKEYTNITDIEVSNMQFPNDNYTSATPLEADATLSYHQFGLKVKPVVEYYSHLENKKPSFSLFPAAYACSPPMPQPSEEIADIAIFSDADYIQANSSKVLAAGDTLNAVFKIYDYYSGRIVGLPDFLTDEGLKASESGFLLQPAVAPASSQRHQFTVHYRLNNGEFYAFTAAPVVLTP